MRYKWSVEVRKDNFLGCWVLDLDREFPDGRLTYDFIRLKSTTWGGRFVSPELWFKPMKERIPIAVRWAIDMVRRVEGLANADATTRAEFNALARHLFEEALKGDGGR